MDNREWAKLAIVEFLGPFALCFMGIGAIIQTNINSPGGDPVAIALAHGLGIGLILVAAGHITGGYCNPALTIGLVVARRLDRQQAIVCIVAQLLGGAAGAGVLTFVYRDIERNAVNLGVPAIGVNHNAVNALIMEIVLTFFLMFVVFGVAIDHRTGARTIAGLAIGLAVTMGILAGSWVSGATMNPARAFGPELIQQDFADFWIWYLGPIIGAVAAAVVYNDVLLGRVLAAAPPSERTDVERPRAVVEGEAGAEAAPVARSRRAQRRRQR